MFLLLEKYSFKNANNSVTLAFFVVEADTKREKMSWQKPLRPISNAWGNSKLPPFLENFRSLNLPPFTKEGMVSIIFNYAFEKLCLYIHNVC